MTDERQAGLGRLPVPRPKLVPASNRPATLLSSLRPFPHSHRSVMGITIWKTNSTAACALLIAAMAFGLVSSANASEPAVVSSPEGLEYFETHIRPLLANHCLECHGDDKQGGLQLDSRAAMLAGSESGPSIIPGKPDESRLIHAVRYDSEPKMPPDGKLAAEEIAKLEHWVSLGAPAPGDDAPVPTTGRSRRACASHWAFQPIANPRFRRCRMAPGRIPARLLYPGPTRSGQPDPLGRRPTAARSFAARAST